MPTNNFKLFDEKKANMMTDEDYAINQQRLNGVQSGVASSQLQNKTLYQTALMCYALAQLMAANGYDANDADAVSTFVNNLSLSMVQKKVDKASATDIAKKVVGKWVDAKQLGELKADVADNYLPLLGGTMLGDLILHSDPVSSLQAATKKYVDENSFVTLFDEHKIQNITGDPETFEFTFNLSNLDFSKYKELEIIIEQFYYKSSGGTGGFDIISTADYGFNINGSKKSIANYEPFTKMGMFIVRGIKSSLTDGSFIFTPSLNNFYSDHVYLNKNSQFYFTMETLAYGPTVKRANVRVLIKGR